METEMLGIIIAVIATFFAAPGPIFLKKAAPHLSFGPQIFMNINFWMGAFFYIIGISLGAVALKFGPLSIIGPVLGLVYAWVSIISIKFLKEELHLKKVIGIIVVLIGVVFISMGI